MLACGAGDRGRLIGGGVIFPEPGVRGEARRPARVERERTRLRVDREGRRAGGGDADADHAIARERPRPPRIPTGPPRPMRPMSQGPLRLLLRSASASAPSIAARRPSR